MFLDERRLNAFRFEDRGYEFVGIFGYVAEDRFGLDGVEAVPVGQAEIVERRLRAGAGQSHLGRPATIDLSVSMACSGAGLLPSSRSGSKLAWAGVGACITAMIPGGLLRSRGASESVR